MQLLTWPPLSSLSPLFPACAPRSSPKALLVLFPLQKSFLAFRKHHTLHISFSVPPLSVLCAWGGPLPLIIHQSKAPSPLQGPAQMPSLQESFVCSHVAQNSGLPALCFGKSICVSPSRPSPFLLPSNFPEDIVIYFLKTHHTVLNHITHAFFLQQLFSKDLFNDTICTQNPITHTPQQQSQQ